jgi:hypothetical protein
MNKDHESAQPEMQAFCTYAVIIHIPDDTAPEGLVKVPGVFMNFKGAVFCLKNRRLTIEDGFITAEEAASRDLHPLRNRIGPLEQSDGTLVGWDYSWSRQTSPDHTNRAWIQKTQVWRRDHDAHDIAELSKEELQELEDEGDIDHIAFGRGDPDNVRFDEASKDFIFKGDKMFNAKPGKAPMASVSKGHPNNRNYSETSTRE